MRAFGMGLAKRQPGPKPRPPSTAAQPARSQESGAKTVSGGAAPQHCSTCACLHECAHACERARG
eukprot:2603556-Alexandrium_andersonii.AAC.1